MNEILTQVEKIRNNNCFNDNIALFLSVYNRPFYLEKVVESLNRCDELSDIPIIIFQDNGRKATIEENIKIVDSLMHKNKFFIIRPVNLGCERNISYGLFEMFDTLKFDKLFVLEDDLVVCKNYFKFIYENFLKIKKEDSNIGVYQGWSKCLLNQDDKKSVLNKNIKNCEEQLWGFMLDKEAFNKIRIHLYEYLKIFQKQPFNVESNYFRDVFLREDIRALYKKMYHLSYYKNESLEKCYKNNAIGNTICLSQDGVIDFALRSEGVNRYCPVVNRSMCIGKIGQHYTQEIWDSHGLEKVLLEEEVLQNS